LAMFAAFSSADTVIVTADVTGLPSVDGLYDSDNFDISVDLGFLSGGYSSFVLKGIGWDDVTIETIGASWLSEPIFSFESASGGDWLDVAPGAGDDTPGTATYSSGGVITLADIDPDLELFLDGDNVLRFHIWEGFDDVPNEIDANILSGTFTLEFDAVAPVPEPASLVAVGLGVTALLRKRRKSA
jgi:hypothetical protein